MKSLSRIFFILTVIFFTTAQANAANEKILYIPVDDRPINFNQTVEILKLAGCEMIVPPKEFFSRYNSEESPDKLWAWLDENISNADAAVISADAVLYGGLIPSRKHNISEEILNDRVNRFKLLRNV